MNEKRRSFGELLIYYRKTRLKANQEELADRISMTREYISLMERGQKPPAFQICEKLATIFLLDDTERQEFYAAAALERLLESDKDFYKVLGAPQLHTKENEDAIAIKGGTKIPIFSYPKTRLIPPYEDKKPKQHILLSNVFASERYYGLFYKDTYSTNEISLKTGDLVIIDPLFERLKTGDNVLVKLFDEVVIRQYSILQIDNRFEIQFLPFPPASTNSFDFNKDKDKFEIFGKAVLAIKRL